MRGYAEAFGATCDGTPQPWTIEIAPAGGSFVGGKSASFSLSIGCGTAGCASGFAEETVKRRGSRS